MKAEEFKKYEGCKTKGKMMGYDLDGGVVVGYDPSDDDMCIIVKVLDSQGWTLCPGEYKFATEKDLNDYRSGKYRYLYVKPEYVVSDIYLTSILKGCEGVELWSDICGVCKLRRVSNDAETPIELIPLKGNGCDFILYLSSYGKMHEFGKCLLWPSETNRDWSAFVAPVKVRDDDFVVACDDAESGHINKYVNIDDSDWKYVIRFEDWKPDLTEKELEKLNVNKQS